MTEDDKKRQGESENDKQRALTRIVGEPPIYIDDRFSDEDIAGLASKLREQSNLLRGLIMGLILGIIGNLFVSHYYPVFSALNNTLFGEKWLLSANIVFMIGFLVMMIYIMWWTYGAVTAVEDVSSRMEAYLRKKQWDKERLSRKKVSRHE